MKLLKIKKVKVRRSHAAGPYDFETKEKENRLICELTEAEFIKAKELLKDGK